MDRYIPVLKHILDLTETIKEGFDFIRENLNEGYFRNTYNVLKDCVEAFFVIEFAMQSFFSNLPPNRIELHTDSLRNCIDQLVYYYEMSKVSDAHYYLEVEILPTFVSWKTEIQECLSKYILI